MTVYGKKPPGNKDLCGSWHSGGDGHGRPAGRPGGRALAGADGAFPSGRALEIRDLVDAVRALPDVRDDKVAAIRQAIESGTYVVDAAKIAQKMIDEIG